MISLVLTGSTVKTTEIFNHETGQKHDTISLLAQPPSEEAVVGVFRRMNVTNIFTGRYLRDSFFFAAFFLFEIFSQPLCFSPAGHACVLIPVCLAAHAVIKELNIVMWAEVLGGMEDSCVKWALS